MSKIIITQNCAFLTHIDKAKMFLTSRQFLILVYFTIMKYTRNLPRKNLILKKTARSITNCTCNTKTVIKRSKRDPF